MPRARRLLVVAASVAGEVVAATVAVDVGFNGHLAPLGATKGALTPSGLCCPKQWVVA